MAKNEIAKIEEQYAVLDPRSDAAEVIRINVGGEDIGPQDLETVKVPTGGGTLWQIPSIRGAEASSELIGIIIDVQRRRAYWSSPNPSGDPPDCYSWDMEIGIGDPGGPCKACPFDQFESALRPDGSPGRGKACKEKAIVFLLRPGDKLPTVLSIPPASLKAFRKYRLQLPIPFYNCVTRFTLREQKNGDGTKYAEVTPEFMGELPPDIKGYVTEYRHLMGGLCEKVASANDSTDTYGSGD